LIFYSKFLSLQKFILERVIKSILLKKRREKEKMDKCPNKRKKDILRKPIFSLQNISKFQKGDLFFRGVKSTISLATKYTPIHHIPYTCTSCF